MPIDAESNPILQFIILRSLGIIVLYIDMDAFFYWGKLENIPHRKPGSRASMLILTVAPLTISNSIYDKEYLW